MNDPNGMVYLEGEYHLFFQYYPDSTVWGPRHWGHAVSRDLLHWEELPIALYRDSLGYIFSGSAVMDHENTSGLGEGGRAPLIAIFTHHDPTGEAEGRNDYQYQSLAYSNDRGRSWTKYPGNPVLPNSEGIRDFRDPKVRWDEAAGQWLMVLAAQDRVKFYTFPNLLDWTFLSDFGEQFGGHGGVWECPDFFPLPLEIEDRSKYVLLLSINPGAPNGGSGTQYFVGDFDGTEFTLDTGFERDVASEKGVWLDYRRDDYAGVTFSDVPDSDGCRLFMGWMSNWNYGQAVPTETWRIAMTLPRALTLQRTPAGLRVFFQPVAELADLQQGSAALAAGDTLLSGRFPAPASPPGGALVGEVDVSFVLKPEMRVYGLSADTEYLGGTASPLASI